MKGLLQVIGEDGMGGGSALNTDQLAAHIKEHYTHNSEQNERRERARLLARYFKSTGDSQIESMIGGVFKDKDIIERRRQWVAFSKFCNVIKRVVGEKSTAYTEPARRKVSGDDNNRRYQDLLKACKINRVSLEWSRQLNLHWTLAVGFRVRQRSR